MARFSWRWPFRNDKGKAPYKLETGSELYEQHSITGLNKLPVTIHSNYICGNAEVSGPGTPLAGIEPMSLKAVTDHRLINGSFVWLNDGGWQLLENLHEVERNKVVQCIEGVQWNNNYTDVIRTYTRTPLAKDPENEALEEADLSGYAWQVVDSDRLAGKTIQGSERTLDDKALIVHANGLGILYPNQWTYKRLEEIALTMKKFQTGAGIKTLVHGFIRNIAEARQELESDESTVSFVPGEVSVDRVTSTDAVTQLKTEFTLWLALYFADMNITDSSYQPDRPVASDRYLTMGPMLRAVEDYRRDVSAVMNLWGVSVEWDTLYTSSVQDRRAQYDMLTDAFTRGVITQADYNARVGKLL